MMPVSNGQQAYRCHRLRWNDPGAGADSLPSPDGLAAPYLQPFSTQVKIMNPSNYLAVTRNVEERQLQHLVRAQRFRHPGFVRGNLPWPADCGDASSAKTISPFRIVTGSSPLPEPLPCPYLPVDSYCLKTLQLLTGLLLIRNSALEESKRACHSPHLMSAEMGGSVHSFRCARRGASSQSKSYHTIPCWDSTRPHRHASNSFHRI